MRFNHLSHNELGWKRQVLSSFSTVFGLLRLASSKRDEFTKATILIDPNTTA